MIVEFLGHAGFLVKTEKLSILIDPWLTSSSFEFPVLESFVPDHKTIDYLIPEPQHKKENIHPDIILLSHYHTHHSPKVDIEYWLKKSSKKIVIIGYDIHPKYKNDFVTNFRSQFPEHELRLVAEDCEFQFQEAFIRVLTYTNKYHLSFFIQSASVSFLHLADAQINRFAFDRRLDPLWHKFSLLSPTFFALSVGTTSGRYFSKVDNSPLIFENSFLSPVEAANLTSVINPKIVGVIGVFNSSIWKNRAEFSFSASENENYFRWAIQHLKKEIQVAVLRPGCAVKMDSNQIFKMELSSEIDVSKI